MGRLIVNVARQRSARKGHLRAMNAGDLHCTPRTARGHDTHASAAALIAPQMRLPCFMRSSDLEFVALERTDCVLLDD